MFVNTQSVITALIYSSLLVDTQTQQHYHQQPRCALLSPQQAHLIKHFISIISLSVKLSANWSMVFVAGDKGALMLCVRRGRLSLSGHRADVGGRNLVIAPGNLNHSVPFPLLGRRGQLGKQPREFRSWVSTQFL